MGVGGVGGGSSIYTTLVSVVHLWSQRFSQTKAPWGYLLCLLTCESASSEMESPCSTK